MTTASANQQHREALEPSLRLHENDVAGAATPCADNDGRTDPADPAARLYDERLRALVECVQDYAIFMLDPDGRVASWNPGAQRIKGYESAEIIGRHFSVFYPEPELRAGKPEHALRTARRDGTFEDEGWRLRKDGSRFWANVILTALRGRDGALLGYAKITRDLSERRKQEDERLQLARAQEAVRLREEFLALASHELRTPLTVLQLQISALRARLGPHDTALAAKLERCARAGHRLAELIDALLDVSRIATGRLELRLEDADLAEIVTTAVDHLQEAAGSAGCTLSVALDRARGRWDRSRIEQVISNLVSNAIRHAAGTPIRVALWRDDTAITLEVRDGGPGVPAAQLPRLFERFERGASMRHFGGLGLGLYMVRQIVRAHGGDVTADNPADGGARFTVRLPAASANHGVDP